MLQAQGGQDQVEQNHPLVQRFLIPQPRLAVGQALRGIASAAIDISDGLLADLGHILQRSQVGALLQSAVIPLSAALSQAVGDERALQLALAAGDDYELCFCVPPEQAGKLKTIAQQTGVRLGQIGEITAEPGLRVQDAQGQPVAVTHQGYQHF